MTTEQEQPQECPFCRAQPFVHPGFGSLFVGCSNAWDAVTDEQIHKVITDVVDALAATGVGDGE